jgi:hypothetical protein
VLKATPFLAGGVAGLAVADGAAFHRAGRGVVTRWSSSATTLAARPWRLLSSLAITDSPRMTTTIVFMLVVGFGYAEHRLGWRRAMAVGVAATLVGTGVCDIAVLLGGAMGVGNARVAAVTPDYGASAFVVGAVGAAAAGLTRWQGVAVAVVALNGVVLHLALAVWEHLVAFLAGYAQQR